MELIDSGLAGMDISIFGECSAKTWSREETRTSTPKTETRPPQIGNTEEQSGEVEGTAPPTGEQEVEEEEEVDEPPVEEQEVEIYRRSWERCFSRRYGSYEAETSLAPMCCAAGTTPFPLDAFPQSSLQFFSIKVTDLSGGLSWPLYVHGFVAARDSVDHRRNYLFRCSRDSCQTLTEKDPYLRLTGPSRAVLMIDPVGIEVQLKLKGEIESEDQVLTLDCFRFRESYPLKDGIRACIRRRRCTLEFALEVLDSSVETTVDVRVVDGSWPNQCAGLIVCNSEEVKDDWMAQLDFQDGKRPTKSDGRIVLLDFQDGKLPTKPDGTVELSRRIVSVDCPAGKLIVSVEASRDGFSAKDTVEFGMKISGTSTCTCDLVFCKMEVTVNWSLFSTHRE